MVDYFWLNSFIEVFKLDLDYTVSFYNRVKRSYLLSLLNDYVKTNPDHSHNENSQPTDKFTIVLNHMSLLRKNPQELNAVSLNYFEKFNLLIK